MVKDAVSNFRKELQLAKKKKPASARKDIRKSIAKIRSNWGLLTKNQKFQVGAVVSAISLDISPALATFLFLTWGGFLIKESLMSDKDSDEDENRLLKQLRKDLDRSREKINDVI